MQSSNKTSPFTVFDMNYYNSLSAFSSEKAEEYRNHMTSPMKGARNLGHEKYADNYLKDKIKGNINYIKEYAQKNSISEQQAIINIRTEAMRSLDDNQSWRMSPEEIAQEMAERVVTTTPNNTPVVEVAPVFDNNVGQQTIELPPVNTDLQGGQVGGDESTPLQPLSSVVNPSQQIENTPEGGLTTTGSQLTPYVPPVDDNVDPYVDITIAMLKEMILKINPSIVIPVRANKTQIIAIYEPLVNNNQA